MKTIPFISFSLLLLFISFIAKADGISDSMPVRQIQPGSVILTSQNLEIAVEYFTDHEQHLLLEDGQRTARMNMWANREAGRKPIGFTLPIYFQDGILKSINSKQARYSVLDASRSYGLILVNLAFQTPSEMQNQVFLVTAMGHFLEMQDHAYATHGGGVHEIFWHLDALKNPHAPTNTIYGFALVSARPDEDLSVGLLRSHFGKLVQLSSRE